MRIFATTACLLAATAGLLPAPASAQTSADDVRCFLLSNVFARQAKEPKAQQLAAASVTFFMGRLDGRLNAASLLDIARRESHAIDPKTASDQMRACVGRLARSQQSLQAALKPLAPAK